MSDVLSDDAEAVVRLAGAEPEPPLPEMETHGRERGFPIVGPAVGRVLRLLARTAGARRIFEFGSGFGYSGAWFAGALSADGELVLTDYDEENLAEAREFLGGTYAPEIRYEAGDAMETFDAYDGPFDVVLIDHEKSQYADAFEKVRARTPPGGLVIADNMLAGPVTPDEVRAALEGEEPSDDHAAGVAAYVERVRDDPAFETALVPLGEGIAVSRRFDG